MANLSQISLNSPQLAAIFYIFAALTLSSLFLLVISKINKSSEIGDKPVGPVKKTRLSLEDIADRMASTVVLYSVMFSVIYVIFFIFSDRIMGLGIKSLALFSFVAIYFLSWLKSKVKILTDKLFKSKENLFFEAYMMAVEDLYYSLGLDEAVNLIVQSMKDHFYPVRAAVLLREDDRFDIYQSWSRDHETIPGSFKIRKDSRLLRRLRDEDWPTYIGASHEVFDAGSHVDLISFLKKYGFRIMAPIIFGEEVIGIVLLAEKRNHKPYLEYELRFLRDLCLSAGLAINNFHKSEVMIRKESALKKNLERDVETKNKELLAKNQELQIINATADDSEQKIKTLTKELEILQKLAKHKGYL